MAGGGDRKGLEFGILGPVVALRDGVDLDLGGQKPRALLAILLLHANEVVSQDALIDQIWGTSRRRRRRRRSTPTSRACGAHFARRWDPKARRRASSRRAGTDTS